MRLKKGQPDIKPTNSVSPIIGNRWQRLIINNTLIVMAATLASRGLGLLREIVVAARFGTSGEYNAYVAAFRIPDLLYLLIIGGALGSALIPVFSRFLGQGETEKAWRLANAVVNTALLTMVFASFIAFVIAPQLVTNLIAPGFRDQPELLQLTINLTRLLLIQPFLLGLGGIAMALLNGSEKFFWPAIAPLFYNGFIILSVIFLTGPPFGVYGMATGVIVGAAIYVAVQLPALVRLGFRYRPRLDFSTPGLDEIVKVLGPRLVGQAAFQFNFFIITNLASRIGDGSSVSALNYAFQLFMLPHGIFALSIATVAFPALARFYGSGDMSGFKTTLTGSLRQIIFFALPASAGLVLLAPRIVSMLFELGKFDQTSTELVSRGLYTFALGLLAYGVVEIVTRAFYALQNTLTPVLITLLTVGLNILLSSILGREETYGTAGLGLSLALVTTFEMLALLWLLRRQIGRFSQPGQGLVKSTIKMLTAVGFMAFILFLCVTFINSIASQPGKIGQIIITIGLIGIGAACYIGAALVLRIEELQPALRRVIRR